MPDQDDIVLIPVPFTDLFSQYVVVKTFGRVNSAILEHIRQTLQDLTARTP